MHNPRQSRINSVSRTVLISPTNRDWDLQAITRRIGQSDWRAASVNAEGPVTHTQPPMFTPSPRSRVPHPRGPSYDACKTKPTPTKGGRCLPLWIVRRYRDRTESGNRSHPLPSPHSVWEIEDSTRINYATNCRDHREEGEEEEEGDYCSIVYD